MRLSVWVIDLFDRFGTYDSCLWWSDLENGWYVHVTMYEIHRELKNHLQTNKYILPARIAGLARLAHEIIVNSAKWHHFKEALPCIANVFDIFIKLTLLCSTSYLLSNGLNSTSLATLLAGCAYWSYIGPMSAAEKITVALIPSSSSAHSQSNYLLKSSWCRK